MGGGLGHATRAYKLQNRLRERFPNLLSCKVILAYQNLPKFLLKSLSIEFVNPNEVIHISQKLAKLIDEFKPDIWITDVFPNGVFYELPLLLEKYTFYKICTVRILKADAYHIHSEILYDEAWQIEWLAPEMEFYLQSLAERLEVVHLVPLINNHHEIVNKNLILHTGSSQERLFLKQKYPEFELMNFENHFPLPKLQGCKVVTAAGCNIVHDFTVQNALDEWYIEPFPRAFDDQSLRYKHLKDLFQWYQNS